MKSNTSFEALVLGTLFALMVTASIGQGVASAQVMGSTIVAQPSSCVIFYNNIRYGAYDYSSNGTVTQLQSFLAGQGYFNSAYLGTGHFGALTLRSVMQFQAAHGVPATGFVGPLTRAVIQQMTCGTNPVPTPTPTPTGTVSMYYLSPNAGAVGTTVSLTGYGFTQDNTVLLNGSVAARNVPISSSIAIACTTSPTCHGGINQTIVFTIPSSLSPNCPLGSACPMYAQLVTPGQYSVTVQNSNGTSNALALTVTSSGTTVQPLSVTGLDAPASLALGQTGTWTVHVAANNSLGTLHYSVLWGDEGTYYNGIMAPASYSVQSLATFTHAYQRAGTFTPTFTVTDDYGHSVSASNTVTVTPLY